MRSLKKLSKNKNEAKDPRQVAIENNLCPKCRNLRIPLCLCKKAGGGSNSEGSKGEKRDADTGGTLNTSPILKPPVTSNERDLLFDLEQFLDSLLIIAYPSQGKLTLYLQPESSHEKEDLSRNLMRMIRMVFNEFKEELRQKGICVDHFRCNPGSNGSIIDELIISFPAPLYYDAFMQRLVDRKLLPQSYIQQTKLDADKPSPLRLSITPKPKPIPAEDLNSNQQDSDNSFRPSPLRTTLELTNKPWNR